MNQHSNSEDILVICSGSMVFWVDPYTLEPRQCSYYEPGWKELGAKTVSHSKWCKQRDELRWAAYSR